MSKSDNKYTAISIIVRAYMTVLLPDALVAKVYKWFAEDKYLFEKYSALEDVFDREVEYQKVPSGEAYEAYSKACEKLGIPMCGYKGNNPGKADTKNVRRLFRRPLVRAAAILVPVLLAVAVYLFNNTGTETAADMIVERTSDGESREITLPDGSSVFMRPNSTIIYAADFADGRKVHLSGEGLFDVAVNMEMPFSVSTDWISIKVHGTKFMLSEAAGARSVVVLYRGMVSVAAGEENITLSPGKFLCYYHNGGEIAVSDFEQGDDTYLFDFYMTSLENILETLAAHYRMGIDFRGAEYKKKYTICFFPDQSVSEAMDMLQLLTNEFDYNVDGNTITLTKR